MDAARYGNGGKIAAIYRSCSLWALHGNNSVIAGGNSRVIVYGHSTEIAG